MKGLREYVGGRLRLVGAGLAMVVVIGTLDYLTGFELSLFILYLVPVSVVASFGGTWPGLTVSLASAGVWLMADVLSGRQYSRPFIPYWNTAVRLIFLSVVAVLQSALAREKYIARTDSLTGLANRKYFFEIAAQEILRSGRYGLPFSTAYIDIDDFKEVNDRYGHAAGDRLLQSAAGVIRRNIRTVDLPARLGGDEFAILMPQADAASARIVLSKLQRLLAEAMDRERWPATFSLGVVTFLKTPASVDEMIQRADKLMYDAKAGGKNSIKFDVYGV